ASYVKSAFRHFFDWRKGHRGLPASEDIETGCCAPLFNVQGYLHEHLKSKAARNAADPATTVAHHATDAPMPPTLTERLSRAEDDDGSDGLKAGEAYRNPLGEDAE